MQLLIILALLLYGGKAGGAQKLISEVKPVIESLGDEDMRAALKSAEEISEVLTAVRSAASAGAERAEPAPQAESGAETCFPLDPINKIADRDIAYSLSAYLKN